MAPVVESPEWWRDRLYPKLTGRQAALKALDDWYSGDHPAPRGYEQATALLGRLLTMTNTNFMQLVVDAAMERMHVEGFRIGGQISDAAWKIWQGNAWDLGSEMVFLESLVTSEALVLVDPTLNEFGVPTLTPEHPQQAIVEYRPGSFRDRVAGLKVFADDVNEHLVATVYTAERVDTWWAPLPRQGVVALTRRPAWEHQDSESGTNSLDEVPLVPFYNRPRMLKIACSEFATVIPIQRRINKTILDRLVMQEYSAFRQKWATGIDIPKDPKTGQDVEPFKSAIDRLFTNEDPEGRFGTFEADDIEGLLKGIDADVKNIAAIVATPPHYLLGDMVNLAAEAMKAAEASLVSRVRRHMRHLEEPQEAVVRLALKAAGETAPDADMETVWRNPEFRTEGELVDALTKMATLGVPVEALWERWGATQTEIGRWKQLREAEALDPLAQRLLREVTPAAGDAGLG